MDQGVKTSALALIPDERAWPVIQAVRSAHDKQVRVWPPHINIIYPFVHERHFQAAGESIAERTTSLAPFKIRCRRKGNFGSTAFLVPECEEDPDLALLHGICAAAFPHLLASENDFKPHLTIGQFRSNSDCQAFLEGSPPIDIEFAVGGLCLLARASMQHPFRVVFRVRFGVGVEPGDQQPYSLRTMRQLTTENKERLNPEVECFYQADESFVRFVFQVDAEELDRSTDMVSSSTRQTLFVVDKSSSMSESYEEVKDAVRYMVGEVRSDRHHVAFVLYDGMARRASAEDVLNSRASGCTNFQEAFRLIVSYILDHPSGTSLEIIFMTDGQDTSSKDLAGATRDFQNFLRTCGRRVTIHCIGFTIHHNRELLEQLCEMGISQGTYRFADGSKGESLMARFTEMFDLVDVNVKGFLRIGAFTLPCNGVDVQDGQVRFDLVVRREILPQEFNISIEPCHILLEAGKCIEVNLEHVPVCPMFAIRCIDELEIKTYCDLEAAQALLLRVQVQNACKTKRQLVIDAKKEAQARLDKYHEVFAQAVRRDIAAVGGNLVAELSSLRHETTFRKARRARSMAQRAAANAPTVQLMEQLLLALPTPSPDELANLAAQQLHCSLSGEAVEDIMLASHRDFFVFSLRVCRPEDVIDAPTVLDILQVLSGTYSNEAFQAGCAHAILSSGPDRAHGGFAGSAKNPVTLGSEVGIFRGPDGQLMNACLPLYLSESHFARVLVQIKPILGYFFTLDPLGYKGDQTLALFGVLGRMLCMRANAVHGEGFSGEWADWLIDDFTKLCRGIHSTAIEYLAQGGYTGTKRGDLLDDFLGSPAGRTKERVPSLGVVIGWSAAMRVGPTPRFYISFVEELWRRGFTTLYKGQPREPIIETLERLLYGPTCDESMGEGGSVQGLLARNSVTKDKEFARWAKFRQGELSQKQAEYMRRKYGTGVRAGPEVEGLLSADEKFSSRTLLRYEDSAEFFDAIVDEQLGTIRRYNTHMAALYEGRPLGEGISASTKRLMLIQSLQYVGNETMSNAIEKSQYLDTFTCLTEEGVVGIDSANERICGQLHQRFEQQRRERCAACVEKRNALLTAQRIVATTDLDAFAGRCAVSCPTRGGEVFHCLVALLAASRTGARAPLLAEKVSAVMTGKIGGAAVLAEGSSWVHCPTDTARQLREAVGDEEFAKIELLMCGTWGHVYRESDIPNRHGHCNSHPNPVLTVSFKGFALAVG